MPPSLSLAALFLVLPLQGCARWSNVRFEPSPLEIAVAPDAGQAALGRAVVSWRGIEREDGVYLARFLVRLESDGPGELRLEPERCVLLDGALEAFGPARAEAERAVEGEGSAAFVVPAKGARVFRLAFPFGGEGDPGDSDLSGLQLRLGVADANGPIVVSTSLERWVPDPYWDGPYYGSPYWHAHGGSGVGVSVTTGVRF